MLCPAESSASGAGSCSNGPRLKRERLTPEEFALHLRLRPDSLALHALLRIAALDFGPSGVSTLTLASPHLEGDALQRATGVGEALAVSRATLSFLVAAASTPIALFTGTNCEPSAMDAGLDGLTTRNSISQQQHPPLLLDSHAFGDLTGRLFTGLREVLNLCAFSRLQQTLACNGQQNGCGEAAFDHQKSPRKRTRKLQENATSGRGPNGGSSTLSPAPDIVLSTLLQSAQVALVWSELQRQQRSTGQQNAAAVSGSSCVMMPPGALAELADAKCISAYLVELLAGARSLPILLAKVPECHQADGTLPSNQHFQPARLLSRTIIALTEYLFNSVQNSGESILVDEIVKVNSLRGIVQSVNMQYNEKHDYCTVFTCTLMCSPRSYCIRSVRLSSST